MAGKRIFYRLPFCDTTTAYMGVSNRWLVGMRNCFYLHPTLLPILLIYNPPDFFSRCQLFAHRNVVSCLAQSNAIYIGFRAGYLTSVLRIVVCVRDKIGTGDF